MKNPTIRVILATTDLAPGSEHAVRAAARLAQLHRAALHVVHAFEPDDPAYAGPSARGTAFPDRLRQAERALAEHLRGALDGLPAPASQRVVIRTPHLAIAELAADLEADLIVLGPHSTRALADPLRDTTVDHVLRRVNVPCVVVPAAAELPPRKVLVPIDLSDPAEGALEAALAWNDRLGGPGTEVPPVLVLHVVPSVLSSLGLVLEHDELQRRLDRAPLRRAAAHRGAVREVVVTDDSPDDAILRTAAESGADLIILPTHGYNAVDRWVIGAVASPVARRAACPVCMLPPALWERPVIGRGVPLDAVRSPAT